MKTHILCITFCFVALCSFSQTPINYGYDAAGNRVFRMIFFSDAQLKSDSLIAEEDLVDDAFAFSEEEQKQALHDEHNVTIYPNPTRGNLTIHVPDASENSAMTIQLFDNSGKLINTFQDIYEYTKINMFPYPHGMYVLRICYARNECTDWKILKQE